MVITGVLELSKLIILADKITAVPDPKIAPKCVNGESNNLNDGLSLSVPVDMLHI